MIHLQAIFRARGDAQTERPNATFSLHWLFGKRIWKVSGVGAHWIVLITSEVHDLTGVADVNNSRTDCDIPCVFG
jgi:hypothetical protein